jgi:hypothetical protein
VSHTLALAEAERAFKLFGESDVLKIQLLPNG